MVAAALGLPADAIAEVPDAQRFVAGFGDLDAELLVPDDFADEVDIVMDALATAAQPDTVPLDEGSDEEEAEGAPGGAAEDEAEAGREGPPAEAAEEVAVANEGSCVGRQPGVFVNGAGKVIGQLHRAGVGRKATCRVHAHCVCVCVLGESAVRPTGSGGVPPGMAGGGREAAAGNGGRACSERVPRKGGVRYEATEAPRGRLTCGFVAGKAHNTQKGAGER